MTLDKVASYLEVELQTELYLARGSGGSYIAEAGRAEHS